MPRQKSAIRKALTPSHLQAIGLVAATWNSLELTLLYLISKMAETRFPTTVAMVSPSNFAAWLDMLRRLTRRSKEHSWKEKELVKICERMKSRHTERNAVVHAVWGEQSGIGLAKTASGFGMPKRGLTVFLEIEKTSAEMRAIAKRILEVEQELIGWYAKQQPMTTLQRLSQGLLAVQNHQPSSATRQSQQSASPQKLADLLLPPKK
jgi:hypothetical protein